MDGISNIKINKLIQFHYKNNALMTLTVRKERYGILKLSSSKRVLNLDEKDKSKTYINVIL